MFCSGKRFTLIIIYLVSGLLPISSDFSKLGGHLKRLIQSCIRSGVAWHILLSISGELLPHLCTIACEINPSAVFWEKIPFLWSDPPAHAVRSFSGELSSDARTFLTFIRRDYPAALFNFHCTISFFLKTEH